jgi:transposase-like protein
VTRACSLRVLGEAWSSPFYWGPINLCRCDSANDARTEEGAMRHYEYLCRACNKKFSTVLTWRSTKRVK